MQIHRTWWKDKDRDDSRVTLLTGTGPVESCLSLSIGRKLAKGGFQIWFERKIDDDF